MIGAGDNYNVAVTAHGEVLEWGDTRVGLRSSDRTKKRRLVPRQVRIKNGRNGITTECIPSYRAARVSDDCDRVMYCSGGQARWPRSRRYGPVA